MKEALSRLEGLPVLVVGDLMVDRYQWGDTTRVSPEAPVPVVRVQREETRLGGAANVAHNLAALGCRVTVCGLVGEDAAGRDLCERLAALGVDTSAVVRDPARPTTVKLRVMSHNQQLLRCDWEDASPAAGDALERLRAALDEAVPRHAGVVVSDYAKGTLAPAVLAHLVAVAGERPVVVDPKGADYTRYRGVIALTPNEHEAAAASGLPTGTEAEALAAGQALLAQVGCRALCITRGPRGVLGLTAETHRLLRARAREVYDVTGAGDTFISVFGALLIAGRPFFECVELANVAAGIVVGKLGTATVTATEMLDFAVGGRKRFGIGEIGTVAEGLRAQGRRIVFTNGCFDLLHSGHIGYLQASREQGDVLVVGLNSDASVRRLKGPSRPVIGEEDRAHLLAALSAVDYVVVFEEDTPEALIRAVRPDVLTKGADYTVDTVVGHELVQSWGGEVKLIPLKENRSTSGLIDRIVSTHRS